MLDAQDWVNIHEKRIALTVRAVSIIDPRQKIRLIMLYPASVGRNTSEVLRVIDSLQTGDKERGDYTNELAGGRGR
ncbi:peroxiredoxin 1 [Endocarpon pusillum]|uniref:Peroxiredoxin 1 n=1 Tax=Endocarpon pusillum TaxID=364733 RepID=A0A8H7E8Z3_9EURO|nr:peroxiredoxin 1 [Endocarpon pusillum]